MAAQTHLKHSLPALLFILAVLFSSCATQPASSPPPASEPTEPAGTPAEPAGAVLATVIDYRELDGCEYLLELSDGQKLQPVNLQDEMKRAGLKLFITYKLHDGMSVCMAGRMVHLTSVKIAKDDNR